MARSLCIIHAKLKGGGNEYKNLTNPLRVDSMGAKGLKKKAQDLQMKAWLAIDQSVTLRASSCGDLRKP